MKKSQMILNTNAETLSQWLENHTRLIYTRYLPTDQGHFTLQRAAPHSLSPGRVVVELNGRYINEEGKDGTAIASLEVSAITFTLLALSKDRLEVRAECDQPIAYPMFDELLTDIAARWPETGMRGQDTAGSQPALHSELGISRPADIRSWKKVWRVARHQFKMGNSLASISKWMMDMGHANDLPYSTGTLRKIFKAGEAGLLD